MRYVLKIAYDGTDFAGWQRQKNALSVQQVLEETILSTLGEDVRVTASGRTDAGVHAAGQVCHFDSSTITVPPEKMPDCLNRFLPPSVRIVRGWGASDDFDSNRSAKRKTYCYSLYVSPREMPLKERYAVRIDSAPELQTLQDIAKVFEGEHDFKAFCASGSSVKTTVRTVYEVRVEETESFGSRDIKIYVTGNGFLYNMVRIIAGTLIEVGSGKRQPEEILGMLEATDRQSSGPTAPAHGLTMIGIKYNI